MLLLFVFFSLAARLGVGHEGHEGHDHGRLSCGTHDPAETFGVDPAVAKAHVQRVLGHPLHEDLKFHRTLNKTVERRFAERFGVYTVLVPVKVHAMVKESCTVCEGGQTVCSESDYVTALDAQNEVDVLNAAFATTGFSFVLSSYELHCDTHSYKNGCDLEGGGDVPMKQSYAVDTDRYLNVYYADCARHGLYGFSTFPLVLDPGGENVTQGVVNSVTSVVGGDQCAGGCEGKTNVHEVGHYFGLYHTFQGDSCDATNLNDYVSDTPRVAEARYGDCTADVTCVDSCEDGGCDMVWNFMDYGDDRCLEVFTVEQGYRMLYYAAVGRPTLLSAWGSAVDDASDNCIGGSYFDGSSCSSCPTSTYNTVHGCADGLDCCLPCPYLEEGFQPIEGAASVYECGVNVQTAVPSATPTMPRAPSFTPACTTLCDATLTVNIFTDDWPGETTWTLAMVEGQDLADDCNVAASAGGPYAPFLPGRTYTKTVPGLCHSRDYVFVITDSEDDGICCSFGEGSYELKLDGKTIRTGGDFGASDTYQFRVGGTTAGSASKKSSSAAGILVVCAIGIAGLVFLSGLAYSVYAWRFKKYSVEKEAAKEGPPRPAVKEGPPRPAADGNARAMV